GQKTASDFIYIQRVSGDKELTGVNIYHFDKQDRLLSVRYAATATFEDNLWRLSQVDESDLSNPNKVTGSQTLT
ncbi:LptF/LptG family permease, partial [Bacillus thuringiensis]|uniref:LptF/LptG family permease n=1 Tax=Bacillus thuringiensis TaxID=1428 RepID=UPI0005B46DF4